MTAPPRILFVEDSEDEFLKVQRHLAAHGLPAHLHRVASLSELRSAIDRESWDVLLSEYGVAGLDLTETLLVLRPLLQQVPLVLLVRGADEQQVVQEFDRGVWDCVLKDHLTLLVPAIRRAAYEADNRRARMLVEAALHVSEQQKTAVFNSVTSHIALLDRNGVIISTNAAWDHFAAENPDAAGCPPRRSGLGSDYLAICRQSEGLSSEGAMAAHDGIKAVMEGLVPRFNLEYPCHSPTEQRWFLMSATPLDHGSNGAVVSHLNITDRKVAELEMQKREARYEALFDEAVDGLMLTAVDGSELQVNAAFARMHGYDSSEEMESLPVQHLATPECARLEPERMRQAAAGKSLAFEVEHYRKDGSTVPLSVTTSRVELGGKWYLLMFHRDITEQKRSERLQALSAEVLGILNDLQVLPEATAHILEAIKRATGIDGAGIRLRQDKDFPYAASVGFSSSFLQFENSLAARTPEGEFCLDDQGNVCLECTCGLVLSAKTDPGNPLFTPGGSAWTNDARSFLNLSADRDPRLRPRNRCLGEGFQSAALIPIRVDQEIVGLLQLNDRRKGWFTPEMIQYFEGLATSFGVAIQRMKEEKAARANQQSLRSLFDAIPESLFLMNLQGIILAANLGLAARLGKSVEECVGNNLFRLVPEHLASVRHSWIDEVVRTRRPVINEEAWGERWLRLSCCPVFSAGGEIDRIVVLGVDITEGKKAEVELRQWADAFEHCAHGIGLGVPGVNQIMTCNSAFAQMLGRCASELTGSSILSAYIPEDHERIKSCVAEADRGGQVRYESRMVRADGSTFPVQMDVVSVRDAHGRPLYRVATAQDITERRRAEAMLHDQLQLQDQLAKVAASVPGLICSFKLRPDGSACMPFATPAIRELYGLQPEDVGNDFSPILRLVHPDDASQLQQSIAESARTMKPWQYTFRFRHPLKGEIWLEGHSVPRLEPDGCILWHGFVQDVTERERAEAVLRQSEQRFRSLVDSSPVAMGFVGRDGAVTFLNLRFTQLFGYSAEDIPTLAEWWRRAYPDEDYRRKAIGYWNAAMEDRSREARAVTPHEWLLTCKDGTLRTVQISGIALADGGLASFVDLTERKRAEEEVRHQSALINSLLDSVPDIIFFKDVKGVYLGCNPAFAKFVGRPREQIIGRSDHDLFRKDAADFVREQDQQMLESLAPRQYEEWITYPDGHRALIDTLKTPYWGPKGELLGVLGISRDVTARKRAEEQLAKMSQILAEGQRVAHMGSFEYVAESQTTVWSEEQYRIYGLDPLGPSPTYEVMLANHIHPDDAALLHQTFAAAMRARSVYELEHRIVQPNGSVRVVYDRALPFLDGNGKLIRYVGATLDITERKRAKEALAEREEIFSSIVGQAAEAIAVLDRATNHFVEFNSAAHEGLGYTRDEFSHLSITDIQAEHSPDTIQRNNQVVREQGGLSFESQHRHRNGSLRDVRVSLRPLHINGHDYLAAVWTDITERKRAKARTARDAASTEFLLELNQRASQMTDRELYDYVLDRAVRLTDSTIGFFHLISEDERAITRTTWNEAALRNCTVAHDTHYSLSEAGNWADCIRQQKPVVYNQSGPSAGQRGLPAGHPSLTRFMSIPGIQEGKVRFIFGVGNKSVDYEDYDVLQLQVVANELLKIMAQRNAQSRLRQSEQRFRHLVETAFDWIWELDATGHFTYTSPKVRDILGYAPEEVVGRTPFDLMPPAEAQRIGALFAQIAGKREAFSGLEKTNLHQNGRQVVLESSGVPVFGEKGELLGYRGMDRDITERKRLETQLRQAQKLEAVGQLAGGVAHDFNNILAAMQMQLGLLEMGPELTPEIKEAMTEIEVGAERAAALTRQLLMFSRRSVLAVRPLDLNEVVRDLLKMLGRLIGEHIRLVFDGQPGSLPSVAADAGMLEQVLLNLVVNARDAMPKGGRVTITTNVVTLGGEESRGDANRRPGRFVCLAVSDTGLGMVPETLERIFEPFFTTKELGKGTGLGLATVHGIVSQHKGWVEVESAAGKGATFRVFLPALAGAVTEAAKASPSAPLERGRETILVVEDETNVRRIVCQSLRALGYGVYEAENGHQALSLWREHGADVDLLFTDMVMPEGMTGLELAERLQALKPNLKVIISSGYSSDLLQSGGIKQAGISYLPKPYRTLTLAESIRASLGSRS